MKKIYLFSALVLSVSGAFAQSAIQQEVTGARVKNFTPTTVVADVAASDTLGLSEFGTQAVTYSSPSGYVFGINDLEDTQSIPGTTIHQLNYEYASGYLVNDPYNVVGAMMFFALKEDVSGTPADLTVRAYSLAPNKALGTATSTAPDAIGPNQTLATVSLPFADVDTQVSTIVMFPTSAWVNADFAIGVDMKDLYGAPADTVALLASVADASDGEYTWTKIGADISPQTLWAKSTILLQGGLDVYVAIFAIVEESLASIEEQGFINGVKLTTYPNPAVSSDNVRIDYALAANTKTVVLNIFDMNGKLVSTIEEGTRNSGIHTVNVPAGTLSTGSYIYAITADNNRIAKRIEVIK